MSASRRNNRRTARDRSTDAPKRTALPKWLSDDTLLEQLATEGQKVLSSRPRGWLRPFALKELAGPAISAEERFEVLRDAGVIEGSGAEVSCPYEKVLDAVRRAPDLLTWTEPYVIRAWRELIVDGAHRREAVVFLSEIVSIAARDPLPRGRGQPSALSAIRVRDLYKQLLGAARALRQEHMKNATAPPAAALPVIEESSSSWVTMNLKVWPSLCAITILAHGLDLSAHTIERYLKQSRPHRKAGQ